jgi:hypothetical protein
MTSLSMVAEYTVLKEVFVTVDVHDPSQLSIDASVRTSRSHSAASEPTPLSPRSAFHAPGKDLSPPSAATAAAAPSRVTGGAMSGDRAVTARALVDEDSAFTSDYI